MQPQVEILDYTEKSIVVRTTPEDFLKNYSQHLTAATGKWIPSLDYPAKGGPTKKAGWIFPKKNEQQVRQIIQQILGGSVPQAPPAYLQKSPPQNGVLAVGSESPVVLSTAPPPQAPLTLAPPFGHQHYNSIVIKPTLGSTLTITVGDQKFPVSIDSLQEDRGMIIGAVVKFPDGSRTEIQLEPPRWQVKGYPREHTIKY